MSSSPEPPHIGMAQSASYTKETANITFGPLEEKANMPKVAPTATAASSRTKRARRPVQDYWISSTSTLMFTIEDATAASQPYPAVRAHKQNLVLEGLPTKRPRGRRPKRPLLVDSLESPSIKRNKKNMDTKEDASEDEQQKVIMCIDLCSDTEDEVSTVRERGFIGGVRTQQHADGSVVSTESTANVDQKEDGKIANPETPANEEGKVSEAMNCEHDLWAENTDHQMYVEEEGMDEWLLEAWGEAIPVVGPGVLRAINFAAMLRKILMGG